MIEQKSTHNPWSFEDEQEHPSCILEWWSVESFFQTKEDKKQWCLKVAMTEWCGKQQRIGSVCNMTLFDLGAKKHYVYNSWTDGTKLQTKPGSFDIRYNASFMKGRFPFYEMGFFDIENNITLEFEQKAESYPHWIGQKITKGWLPMGLGYYRYGIIPKNHIQGTMNLQGKTQQIEGTSYFEHIWGDFDFDKPLANLRGFGKTFGIYTKILLWWLSNHHHFPRSITLATENNPFGYDWVWAVFENGWSIFFGNAMFWLMDGPSAGIFVLTKDGHTYTEFPNTTFHYKKLAYSKEFDFYYPTVLELIATNDKESLHLTCTGTHESREYTRVWKPKAFLQGLTICEIPGRITGYYDDGTQRIPLSGFCKIEPQREITALGHNTKKIEFLLPPKGIGVSFALESHLLLKKIAVHITLVPHCHIAWEFKRIDPSTVHRFQQQDHRGKDTE